MHHLLSQNIFMTALLNFTTQVEKNEFIIDVSCCKLKVFPVLFYYEWLYIFITYKYTDINLPVQLILMQKIALQFTCHSRF